MLVRRGALRDKRGEFYLIAAIIIAIAVIGITSVTNYSKKQSTTNLDEVKEEIQIESSYILDYANYNGLNDEEINSVLEDFSNDYISVKSQEKNLYFVFGEKSNFTLVAYQSQEESVEIETNNETTSLTLTNEETYTDYYSTENNVTLILDGSEREFEMKEGENFYFVISSKTNGEKHVASN